MDLRKICSQNCQLDSTGPGNYQLGDYQLLKNDSAPWS